MQTDELANERTAILQNKRVNDAIQTALERGELVISSEGWLTALRDRDPAEVEIERLRSALQDVVDPLGKLRREAEAQGSRLSGMAYSIANDLHFVQGLARIALQEKRL